MTDDNKDNSEQNKGWKRIPRESLGDKQKRDHTKTTLSIDIEKSNGGEALLKKSRYDIASSFYAENFYSGDLKNPKYKNMDQNELFSLKVDNILKNKELFNKAKEFYLKNKFNAVRISEPYKRMVSDIGFIEFLKTNIDKALNPEINRSDKDFYDRILEGELKKILSKENKNQLNELYKEFKQTKDLSPSNLSMN